MKHIACVLKFGQLCCVKSNLLYMYIPYMKQMLANAQFNMPFEERVKHGPYSDHKNEGTIN